MAIFNKSRAELVLEDKCNLLRHVVLHALPLQKHDIPGLDN